MTRIQIDGLTKRYRGVAAVDDLTFAPAPGRVTGFVGNNGAGKSTTLRMLLGLTRPTAGTATIDGHAYADLPDPIRAIGAMVDPNVFHPARSGRNALRVVARAAKLPDARVDQVLGLVDLDKAAGRRVGGYSLGMRQRLALAAALLGDPAALVLDEPANGLDPHGVHWLRGLLRGLAAEGRTVLISSHLLAELAQTVDDVVVIDEGRLVTHQPMSALLASAEGSSLEDVFMSLTTRKASS
ncbi:MAG: type transport system ATP-binding protein [Actinomycetota bacterium]|nr:type transport system ATP-binding protein [Actinomycetota bacterium]